MELLHSPAFKLTVGLTAYTIIFSSAVLAVSTVQRTRLRRVTV